MSELSRDEQEKDLVARKKNADDEKYINENQVGLTQDSKKLEQKTGDVDNNLPNAKTAATAGQNTNVFKQLTAIGLRAVEYLRHESRQTVDPQELLKHLVDNYDDSNSCGFHFDFVQLGKAFRNYCSTAPTMSCMFGPLKSESLIDRPRERAAPKRKPEENNKQAKEIAPDEVTDPKENTQTAKRAHKNLQILQQHAPENKPMNYFKFVVNPDSFTETVENMFDLSFSIKEGQAAMKIDKDKGYPVVYRVKNTVLVEQFGKTVFPAEAVIKLDYSDFKDIIKAFNIGKSTIPSRKNKR